MMFLTGQKRSLMAEINVVPLVDVVLVLLIIFMVTAPLLYRGIDINLPRSATNTIQPEERVVITVEKNQEIFVDKDRVTVDRVEPILETIKRVGIDKLGMVTEPATERGTP